MATLGKGRARLALAIVMIVALMATLAMPVAAADIRGSETLLIGQDEVIDDDLFLAGNSITVDGTVNGNLFIVCAQAEINGTVNGSLFFAGQTLVVNGTVRDSALGAGSDLVLGTRAAVGRNVLIAGYGLEARPGSKIGRDLLMVGYQGLLGGEVVRDVKYAGGALELNGKVGRDVEAEVGQSGQSWAEYYRWPGLPETVVAQGLRVSRQATIGGNLTYSSLTDQTGAIQARPAGQVFFRQQFRQEPQRPSAAALALGWLLARAREFFTLLLLGILAAWLLPGALASAAEMVRARPLPAMGWGLIAVVAGYAGALVLGGLVVAAAVVLGIVTLGGLAWTVLSLGLGALGLAFTVFQLLVTYGSKLVVAYLVGRLLLDSLKVAPGPRQIWPAVAGVVLYVLVRWVPVLGFLIGAVVTLAGLGAIWLAWLERRHKARIVPAA